MPKGVCLRLDEGLMYKVTNTHKQVDSQYKIIINYHIKTAQLNKLYYT